jgi:ribosome-associated protein
MSNKSEANHPAEIERANKMRDVVVTALEDAKGEDIKVLDVRALTDITDYMIVSTGTSDRHVKTLANRVLEHMHEAGWQHIGVEGEDAKDWVLVDFVDVIIHIMREKTRKRYDLESLWDKTFSELLPEGTAAEIMGNG